MDGKISDPRLISYLKQQNTTGKIVLFTAWLLSMGSVFVLGDELYAAVIALCIAVIGWFLGGYYISRSFLIVRKPGLYRIFIGLIVISVVIWYWYHIWEDEFLCRDYDAGTIKMILGLPFLFFPLLEFLIRYNFRAGTYRRILEKYPPRNIA